MTLTELQNNNEILKTVGRQTLKNHIVKNEEYFKDSILIFKNEKRRSFRVLDSKKFVEDYKKLFLS